jgi:23S rRNA (uracil1939-C5)-methyltransferase
MEIQQRLKLEVTSLTHEGFGVGKENGLAIFIPGALVGETVICEIYKVEKSFCYANLIEIVKSSPDRVKPVCEIFGKCGGCEIMHLDYKKQLEYKVTMAEETFKRIGHLDLKVNEILGMDNPYYYRNKIQVPFGTKKNKVIAGYFRRKSHDIIPFDNCYIQPLYDTEIIKFIRNLANEYKVKAYDEKTRIGCLRHVLIRSNYQDQVMVVLITNEDKINKVDEIVKKMVNRYPNVISVIQNINKSNSNVILGRTHQVLYGEEFITDRLNDLNFKISHYSFFQVNRVQTEKLYQRVLDYLKPTKDDIIIDGYCGVGTITLTLAQHVKFAYGIEIVKDAIENAKVNATLNKIDNVKFIVGAVEEEIQTLLSNKISGIVLDPPRKGIEKSVLESIIQTNINRIVYVSCDVATLARDLSILSEAFYIQKVTLVDMFCQTCSAESVVLLERK